MAVGLYITAAYWFTASTSFANPAVTIARSFSDSFAGIRPEDAPMFIVAQLVGGVRAVFLQLVLSGAQNKTCLNHRREKNGGFLKMMFVFIIIRVCIFGLKLY